MYELDEIDTSLARVDAMAKINDELEPLLNEIYLALEMLKESLINKDDNETINGVIRGLGRLITDSYDFMQTSVAKDLAELLDRIKEEF